MGNVCVHCEKKIGFLKTPIEGIYCSYDCRNAARDHFRESERKSQERIVEAQRKAAEQAAESQRRVHAEQAAMQVRGRCPKCSAPWAFSNSGAPHGAHSGKCSKCLFTTEFASIELCPVCKCQSLVVSVDADTRCPRCKYRGQARAVSQTA